MSIRFALAIVSFLWGMPSSGQSLEPLVHEGTVNAPIEKVWNAWTTSDGLQSWLAPHAEIDLRVGGRMRANYDVDGDLSDPQTIENTVLSYEPYRMFSIHVTKPPDDFPFAETVGDMWTVVYFEPLGPDQTAVRVVALGFTADSQSQAMRAFFDRGNALTIAQMQQRLGTEAGR